MVTSEVTSKVSRVYHEVVQRPVGSRFSIPKPYWGWRIADLPMSVRLGNVLRKAGYRSLGDLHGMSHTDVIVLPKCGIRSVRELERLIQRIVTGGFDRLSVPVAEGGCAALIDFIDDRIAGFEPRKRKVLLLRLGATGKKPLTLEEIGSRHGFARQYTQQIFDGVLEEMRRLGGPLLRTMLRGICDTCLGDVCPLTPELLQRWAGDRSFHFGVQFYVRLLGKLEPGIPAWPEGRPAASTIDRRQRKGTRRRLLEIAIRRFLKESITAVPLSEVFETLRKMSDFEALTAQEFLDAMKRLCRTQAPRIEMIQTDKALVSYSNTRSRRCVYEALSLSDQPLTPQELLDHGRGLYGDGFTPQTLGGFYHLTDHVDGGLDAQLFLLGPGTLGLLKHIKLPQRLWAQVKSDCYRLLKRENRSFSTYEIIGDNYFAWAALTNEYELAAILKADDRFVKSGRLTFSLKEWGLERAVTVFEAVEEVLAKVGRPLPAYKIRAEVLRLRPMGKGVSNVLRTHPNLSCHGQGYYGLKSWGKRAKTMLAADLRYVNRVIVQSTEPLTFEQLCQAVGVPSTGPLAAILWETVRSAPKVKIERGARDVDAVICHSYWGKRSAERKRRRRIRESAKLQRGNADQ